MTTVEPPSPALVLTSGPENVNRGWDSRLCLSRVPFTSMDSVYSRLPCAQVAAMACEEHERKVIHPCALLRLWL